MKYKYEIQTTSGEILTGTLQTDSIGKLNEYQKETGYLTFHDVRGSFVRVRDSFINVLLLTPVEETDDKLESLNEFKQWLRTYSSVFCRKYCKLFHSNHAWFELRSYNYKILVDAIKSNTISITRNDENNWTIETTAATYQISTKPEYMYELLFR